MVGGIVDILVQPSCDNTPLSASFLSEFSKLMHSGIKFSDENVHCKHVSYHVEICAYFFCSIQDIFRECQVVGLSEVESSLQKISSRDALLMLQCYQIDSVDQVLDDHIVQTLIKIYTL